MYKAFYSLSQAPFSKENSKLFGSQSAREAQGHLEYLKKARGMGFWWANPGPGKPLHCAVLQKNLTLLCSSLSTSLFPRAQ